MHASKVPSIEMIPLTHQIAREVFADMGDIQLGEHSTHQELRKNHIRASHETIWSAAQIALEGVTMDRSAEALILGAGSCGDIPLEQLADAFDRTTLVDMDIRHTLQARNNLPASLRKKVDVVAKDITGVFDEATAWIGDDFKYFISYLAHATDVFTTIDPMTARPTFDSHDFVVSHLVHDQFLGTLARIVRGGGAAQFGFAREYSDDLVHDFYWNALKAIGGQMQAAHFDVLADTVHASGIVHFAGSYDFRYHGSQGAHDNDPPLEQAVDRFNVLTDPNTWQWRISPTLTCSVAAYVLQATK